MLVLSRKVGERLILGNDIAVEVVRVRGNRVRLGIVAPASVPIKRGELKSLPASSEQQQPQHKAA
jgi:carbon storage regulator